MPHTFYHRPAWDQDRRRRRAQEYWNRELEKALAVEARHFWETGQFDKYNALLARHHQPFGFEYPYFRRYPA